MCGFRGGYTGGVWVEARCGWVGGVCTRHLGPRPIIHVLIMATTIPPAANISRSSIAPFEINSTDLVTYVLLRAADVGV